MKPKWNSSGKRRNTHLRLNIQIEGEKLDQEGWIADVAAFAARPSPNASSALDVTFSHLEVRTDRV